MKIRPERAELFHADGQTGRQRHDEANSRFCQFCECAYQGPLSTCLHIPTSYQTTELLLFLRTVILVIRLNFVPENGSDSKTSDSGIAFHMLLHRKNTGCPTRYRTRHFFNNFPTYRHKLLSTYKTVQQ